MSPESNDAIHIYLRDIAGAELLTPEEEVELAKRIKAGDEKAKQRMIQSNLRLVVKIAGDYVRYGLSLPDLISEGNIGLMKAVERFDPEKRGKLSTYAAWWIKQSVKRALINQGKTIRLPAHIVEKVSKMRKVQHQLTEKLGREPSTAMLAEALDVPESTVIHWQTVSLSPSSLDAPLGDGADAAVVDLVEDGTSHTPFDDLSDHQLREEIEELLHRLNPREQEILKHRYGLKGVDAETLEQIGERLNISRERVRQVQNAAIMKLRDMMEEQDHPDNIKEQHKT